MLSEEDGDSDQDSQKTIDLSPENSTDEMETFDVESNWDLLPSIPLQMIYSRVNRNDQSSMSLVCKNWKSEFDAPNNWRKFLFLFPVNPCESDVIPVVKFARRYSTFIRHLEVVCRCVSTSYLRMSTDQFDLFIDAIHDNANLRSIVFFNLKSFLRWLDNEWRARVVGLILKLFRSQKYITSVDFKTSCFTRSEAISLFSAIFGEGQSPIQNLSMRKLVIERPFDEEGDFHEEERETFKLLIPQMLKSMVQWESDYVDFVEMMITGFSDLTPEDLSAFPSSRFKKMIIRWEGWDFGNIQAITSDSWSVFQKAFPELRVEYAIGPTSDPGRAIQFFLPKYVPLSSLMFRPTTRILNAHDFSSTHFFNHLIGNCFYETLEDLQIVWLSGTGTLLAELDNFIRYCPKLRTVEVQVFYPLPNLENLFDSWIRDCPKSIEVVSITVSNIPDEEMYVQMYSLADNFVPILQVMGVNFILILDLPNIQ